MRNITRASIGIPVAGIVTLLFAPVALAATAQITGTESGAVQPIAVGECRNDGGACDVATGKTLTSEVNSSGGMNVEAFNATFGTSYSESFTVTTGCHEDKMGKGEVLVAFPRGDFVTFRDSSGEPGSAFFPNGIQCERRSDW